MRRITWQQIVMDADTALALCRDVGLGDMVAVSRFAVYQERLHSLIDVLASGGQQAAQRLFDGDRLTNAVAMGESAELATLLAFLKSCPAAVLRTKMQRVLRGPVLPTEEDQNTSIGRNTLFELNLAAKLWGAGLNPVLGERPDLMCAIDGRLLVIECKRPTSTGGVRKAIKRARDQIRTALKHQRAGSRGVIAVSLAKIVNPGDQLFVYSGETAGRRQLAHALDSARLRFQDSCAALPNQIMGMLWHVITVGVDEALPLWTLVQELTVEGFKRRSELDDRELRLLYEEIRRFFY